MRQHTPPSPAGFAAAPKVGSLPEELRAAEALPPCAANSEHGHDHHAELHAGFRWAVPPEFNIAEACCGRWARSHPQAVAVREDAPGRARLLRFGELKRQADSLAAALQALGVQRGERVALLLPQRAETAVALMAVLQLGAVAMPLSILFGAEALAFRLADGDVRVAIADESALPALQQARADCPSLATLLTLGAADGLGDASWRAALRHSAPASSIQAPRADDPALLIYTSGTTGPPKGALIPHRALIGNLSGFVCSQNLLRSASARPPLGPGGLPRDAVFWSPADWAWTGGLMDALLPSLYFALPIVASRKRFSAEGAFALMQQHKVTHSFLFPTALKAMMKAVPEPRSRYALRLRAVMSAGEAVGDTVFHWCRESLGVAVNEMFGQTEVNYIVGNCSQAEGWPVRPGSMGRAYPGHRVAVVDEQGQECPRGTPGDVAVHSLDVHGEPDPIFFLGYWKREEATRAKFTGPPEASWCRTGDLAVMDEDGYLWYQGRSDDMFKAAGYRIGPSEVENCLLRHRAVANAAVVPKPDAERGALVKAYVVLAAGFEASAELVADLQQHVRGRLAPYEYPKEIEFIAALPMTTTGKVQRRVLRLQEEARACSR